MCSRYHTRIQFWACSVRL